MDYQNILNFLDNSKELSFEESFNLIKYCSSLISSSETENLGRDLVIRLCDKKDIIHKNLLFAFNSLIESYGLYPYIDINYIKGSSKLRFEYHQLNNLNIPYHNEQQIISNF